MSGKAWSEKDKAYLRKKYPSEATSKIAAALGRTAVSVYQRAVNLGIAKSPEYIARHCRMQKGVSVGKRFQFPPGHVPANKGLRRPGWAPGRMATTQFKSGERSGVALKLWKPIGTQRISKDGYLEIKVNDGFPLRRRWRAAHLILWEAEYGPVPESHAVVFRNGNKRDIRLENLELIRRSELMRRNAIHNLPPRTEKDDSPYQQREPGDQEKREERCRPRIDLKTFATTCLKHWRR